MLTLFKISIYNIYSKNLGHAVKNGVNTIYYIKTKAHLRCILLPVFMYVFLRPGPNA